MADSAFAFWFGQSFLILSTLGKVTGVSSNPSSAVNQND
ncbi:Conserved hypothetical protein [Prochlorococcus marinus str. MIT 9313]|uniref:Uncharacterized protein n=1 Tax=Prochlorococcus marinus (strain MIT 9313) TaxID=74547 RepID=B9ES26_PROMM|nr:Conserved hypothetical protein [Prochlorococcus marinus str. MIT 9313]